MSTTTKQVVYYTRNWEMFGIRVCPVVCWTGEDATLSTEAGHIVAHKNEWHSTLEAARKHVEKSRVRKIDALYTKIAKLKKMEVTVTATDELVEQALTSRQ